MRLRLLILLLSVLALPAFAEEAKWWDKEWSIRRQITIDTSAGDAAISDPIGNTMVLLRLFDATYKFDVAREDGTDIRIVAEDGKTVLPSQVEKFEQYMHEGFVWVRVPALKSGGKTTLWLYYGNTGEKAPAPQDPKAAFEPETQLVYHFSDNANPPIDATGKGNTAQNAIPNITGALIAGGGRLTGRNPLTIPDSDSLNWTAGGNLTVSFWFKHTAEADDAVILSRGEGSTTYRILLNKDTPALEINSERAASGKPLQVGTWHHFTAVSETGKTTLYVDGEVAATAAASLPALTGSITIGGSGAVGEIDELNLAKLARSAGWAKFAALSQGDKDRAGKLISFGNDEESGGGGGGGEHAGYFGVIIKSLTVDGWVVIGLLGVMLVISWWVMVTKIGYLNALSKANALFMREWGHVMSDLTVLDEDDEEKTRTMGGRIDQKKHRQMRQSSVYRIYHIGVEEIRHRLRADRSQRVLSAHSIQSIRASLDGALVREKQIIDKLIVLLTICISGGPFLGLLGTVVGVMITFAAVAAAGDVNVNAIAPGIAAALLATVAGLAVAIPALFGYNYILSRVKDATADMHVFIDEFVTRMAEFYAGPERPLKRRNVPSDEEVPEFAEAGV